MPRNGAWIFLCSKSVLFGKNIITYYKKRLHAACKYDTIYKSVAVCAFFGKKALELPEIMTVRNIARKEILETKNNSSASRRGCGIIPCFFRGVNKNEEFLETWY